MTLMGSDVLALSTWILRDALASFQTGYPIKGLALSRAPCANAAKINTTKTQKKRLARAQQYNERSLFKDHQNVPCLNGLCVLYYNFGNFSLDFSFYFVHIFHGFDDADGGIFVDGVADLDEWISIWAWSGIEDSCYRRGDLFLIFGFRRDDGRFFFVGRRGRFMITRNISRWNGHGFIGREKFLTEGGFESLFFDDEFFEVFFFEEASIDLDLFVDENFEGFLIFTFQWVNDPLMRFDYTLKRACCQGML